jgi:hypothetical protein
MSTGRRSAGRQVVWGLVVAGLASSAHRAAEPRACGDDRDDGSFSLTEPIACKEIKGYEDYVVLPGAALTADEKLLVYFRPRHYKSSRVGGKCEAHLTQEGRIRRRGEKAVLWSKQKLVDYQVKTDDPPQFIYIRDTISLKGLKPGEYDFDIVLHDEVGRSAPAVRTLPFRVIPSPRPPDGDARSENGGPGRSSEKPGPP